MPVRAVPLLLLPLLVAPLAAQEARDRFVTVGDSRIFVTERGAGTPVVFVHGGPGDNHLNFLPHVEELARTHRVILYDQNDVGRSTSATARPHTIAREVETLEAVRAALGLERLDLVGHSWGTILALSYADAHPARVARLMLVGSIGTDARAYQLFGQRLMGRLAPEDMTRLQALQAEGRLTPKLAHEEIFLPHYFHDRAKTRRLGSTIDYAITQELAPQIMRDFHLGERVGTFRFPIRVVMGARDLLTLDDMRREFAAAPEVSFVEIAEAGHWPFAEQPERFAAEVRAFFR